MNPRINVFRTHKGQEQCSIQDRKEQGQRKSKGSIRARAASGARAVNTYQQGFNVVERPRG